MSRRRGGTVVVKCVEPGCHEDALFDWENRTQRAELERKAKTYRCLKHDKPEEWLRQENPRVETVLVASRLAGLPQHLFWVRAGSTTGNGFAHGSGYRAFTDDVPEGTILRVVATLEFPAPPVAAKEKE